MRHEGPLRLHATKPHRQRQTQNWYRVQSRYASPGRQSLGRDVSECRQRHYLLFRQLGRPNPAANPKVRATHYGRGGHYWPKVGLPQQRSARSSERQF